MVYTPDNNEEEMHGTLIDSHHRSTLNIAQSELLSSSEDMEKPTNDSIKVTTPLIADRENPMIHLAEVIEDDEDEKQGTASVTHSTDFFRWTPGHRRVMLTFGTICLFAFMNGVEYGVILPTAFNYVQKLTPINIYVGLVLSSYSIAGSIMGVILGKISDITGKVKILMIIANICQIAGNILYFVTENIHVVLLGRFIAGVGMGVVPPILADVAHRTTEKDRTNAIAIILGSRQLGLLVGPCFTLLVSMMDFYIGSVHVNKLNGPGFLMASIGLILQIVCWFCFYDRTPSTTTGPSTSDDSPKHKYTRSDHPSRQEQEKLSRKTYCDQYLRIEMFVLFLATFITYFNQTALETIVVVFTEKHFKWNTVHTSILFAFAGVEVVIVYLILVFFLSKRFEDRFLLLFAFLSITFACTIGAFFTWAEHSFGWSAQISEGVIDKRLLATFIIFVLLDLVGLPILAATSVSLCTKLTIKELLGFSQGLQRFTMGVGTIVGPLFASALLNREHIMMSSMLGLTLFTSIALLFVLNRLRPLSQQSKKNDSKSDANDLNNNNTKNSSEEDDSDESALPLSSKNRYVTLVQHDDEQKTYHSNRTSKSNSLTKRLSNNLTSSLDSPKHSLSHHSLRFDTSSTNVLCLSDEQHRTKTSVDDSSRPSSLIS